MSHPDRTPVATARAVTTGNIRVAAMTRGVTRYPWGLMVSTSSASTCSVTRMVPSSAATLAPTRPASAMPVSTGPSSSITALVTRVPTKYRGMARVNM